MTQPHKRKCRPGERGHRDPPEADQDEDVAVTRGDLKRVFHALTNQLEAANTELRRIAVALEQKPPGGSPEAGRLNLRAAPPVPE